MVDRAVLDAAILRQDQARVDAATEGDEPYELGADSRLSREPLGAP